VLDFKHGFHRVSTAELIVAWRREVTDAHRRKMRAAQWLIARRRVGDNVAATRRKASVTAI
jgi:hypothetical protein